MSARLPAGLADPLPLLEPVPWGLILRVVAVLALLGLLLWARRRRKRRRKAVVPPPPLPKPPAGLADRIRELFGRHAAAGTYRLGCHELSLELRRSLGSEFTVLTARETGGRLGERPIARLLALVSDLQFRRREPEGDDFEGVCELALETVDREPPTGMRP